MTEVDKRAFVAALYPSKGWKRKVAQMTEPQITAIYLQRQAHTQDQKAPKKEESDDIPF